MLAALAPASAVDSGLVLAGDLLADELEDCCCCCSGSGWGGGGGNDGGGGCGGPLWSAASLLVMLSCFFHLVRRF